MSFLHTLVNFITLEVIALAFLGLSFLWILKLYLKKEKESLFLASLIFFLSLVAFIFFQKNEIGNLNYYQTKEQIFPEKTIQLNYYVEEGSLFNEIYRRYIFTDPKPKLSLSLDKTGKYLNLNNVSPVNRVLKALGLPPVTSGVPELASITGSRFDINHYRWDNYSKGILIIERTQCRDKKTFQTYHCLAVLTIKNKY